MMDLDVEKRNTLHGLSISPKQARTIARANGRVNVWNGAIRSGKTFSSILAWLAFITHAPKGGDLVMVGRTRDSLFRNVISPMQDPNLFGPDIASQVIYTGGAPTANILGRTVHIMGASDKRAENSIRGMTLAGGYVDEVTVCQEDFFTQLLGRMSIAGAQLFCTTNPDNPSHWFKKKFLDRVGPDRENGQLHDWKVWYFNLNDNPSLSIAYKRNISAEFTGLFYRRFILGEWVSGEGAVFDLWNPQDHIVQDQDMPRISRYYSIGIDYGTTNSTVAILFGLGEDGVLYAVDEWRYTPSSKAKRKTDAGLSAEIVDWIKQPHDPHYPNVDNVAVVVDPAAASFRVQLMQDGKRTIAAENDVLYGIRTVTSLLERGKLRINSRCEGLIDEFPAYTWDPKATNEGKDSVIKQNDHSLDALRYAIVTTERMWRRDLQLLSI